MKKSKHVIFKEHIFEGIINYEKSSIIEFLFKHVALK